MRKADRFDKMAERLCSYDTTIRASIADALRRVARAADRAGYKRGIEDTWKAHGKQFSQRQTKRAPGEREG